MTPTCHSLWLFPTPPADGTRLDAKAKAKAESASRGGGAWKGPVRDSDLLPDEAEGQSSEEGLGSTAVTSPPALRVAMG